MLRREAAVSTRWVHLSEAIKVELPDEAGEVLGLEGVQAVCAGRNGGQDLPLKELPIDDDGLTLTIPENGSDCRVANQAPQLSGKVVGVDVDREQPSTYVHVCFLSFFENYMKNIKKNFFEN